jgi:hypothetical protein
VITSIQCTISNAINLHVGFVHLRIKLGCLWQRSKLVLIQSFAFSRKDVTDQFTIIIMSTFEWHSQAINLFMNVIVRERSRVKHFTSVLVPQESGTMVHSYTFRIEHSTSSKLPQKNVKAHSRQIGFHVNHVVTRLQLLTAKHSLKLV